MPFGRPIADFPKVETSDVSETFADSLGEVTFDAQTLRIEFCVTRAAELKPGTPASGKRHVVSRIVITPEGAIQMLNAMAQIQAALKQAGIIKEEPVFTSTPPSTAN